MIVIGTRGQTGFKNLISGNIASSVLTYSYCTITTVKRTQNYSVNFLNA
ncbi:MAG: hypothetical protein ACTHLL_03855 [Candidatus Nitrosocosmicus sp.]